MNLQTPPPLGVYVHWPYCARICPYCDFNVVRDRSRRSEQLALTRAIVGDLRRHAALMGKRRLVSIYLGGGTPSLMAPDSVAAIVETARGLWPSPAAPEITLEANPTDAEADRFADLAQCGVNRISLGVQALDDDALRFLGRNHDAAAGRRAVERAAAVFARVSIDLIYALPGQAPGDWAASLSEAIALGVEHISPYQLTIEPGTAFHRAVSRGVFSTPEPDLAAELFDTTQSVLGAAGFDSYEVSNHARRPSARALHNLIYWRGHDYIGVGPGAHGRLTLDGERHATAAPQAIRDYINPATNGERAPSLEKMSAREVALERLFMGLRTWEGVALTDLAPLEITADRLNDLAGSVVVSGGRLFTTNNGRLVLDRIVAMLADSA